MGNRRLIAESNKLVLEHEYEYVCLVRKSDKQVLLEDNFYGDPTCGLIDEGSTWVLVAGEHMTLWTSGGVEKYESEEFRDIYALRVKDLNTVEILTDPWAIFSAVWELDLKYKKLEKVKSFSHYHGQEYSDNVKW